MKISKFRLPFIKFGYKQIDKHLIQKIKFAPLRNLLQSNLGLMVNVTDKLTDKDPNNLAQLQAVWEEHRQELRKDTKKLLQDTIDNLNLLIPDTDDAQDIIEMLQLLYKEKRIAAPMSGAEAAS